MDSLWRHPDDVFQPDNRMYPGSGVWLAVSKLVLDYSLQQGTSEPFTRLVLGKVSSCLSGINREECRGTVKTRDLTEPRVLSSQGYSTGLSFCPCLITRGRRSRGVIGFLCEGSPSGYWSKASQSPCTTSPRRGGLLPEIADPLEYVEQHRESAWRSLLFGR